MGWGKEDGSEVKNQVLSRTEGLRGDQERKVIQRGFGDHYLVFPDGTQRVSHQQLGHGGIFGRPSPGCTGRLFGLVSTAATAIIRMIGFLLPGERMCPTELGRDRNQEDHKRKEGNS